MIRTQVYIPDELYESAKATAQLQNTTISKLMRLGLEMALKNEKKTGCSGKWLIDNLTGIGKGKAGVEAALNHNDIYDI